jgi:SAM-dependent methyltransferase
MLNNNKLDIQESEYWFPYHYVGQFKDNRFKHFFLDTWAINYVSTIEYLLDNISTSPGDRIVDIGCGDGRLSRELALTYEKCSVIGIDFSPKAIALSSALNADVRNLKFKCHNILKKEISFHPFDTAMLIEVLEHIPLEDAIEFIRGVRRLLKKNGVLYLTVPHKNKPLEYKHFQHFSVDGIINHLQPPFDVTDVVPFEKISWRRIFLNRILSNKWFILKHPRLLKYLYLWYKKDLFFCQSEKDCQRIFIKAVAV